MDASIALRTNTTNLQNFLLRSRDDYMLHPEEYIRLLTDALHSAVYFCYSRPPENNSPCSPFSRKFSNFPPQSSPSVIQSKYRKSGMIQKRRIISSSRIWSKKFAPGNSRIVREGATNSPGSLISTTTSTSTTAANSVAGNSSLFENANYQQQSEEGNSLNLPPQGAENSSPRCSPNTSPNCDEVEEKYSTQLGAAAEAFLTSSLHITQRPNAHHLTDNSSSINSHFAIPFKRNLQQICCQDIEEWLVNPDPSWVIRGPLGAPKGGDIFLLDSTEFSPTEWEGPTPKARKYYRNDDYKWRSMGGNKVIGQRGLRKTYWFIENPDVSRNGDPSFQRNEYWLEGCKRYVIMHYTGDETVAGYYMSSRARNFAHQDELSWNLQDSVAGFQNN